MEIEDFSKSECWIKKGKKFSVEIKHWISESSIFGPENRWNVYVYFFPGFPGFESFEESLMVDLPINFNWGNTYEKFIRNKDGKITCKQYGNDYMHIRQERFTKYSTIEEGYEVFNDACEYFLKLSKIESEQS